MNKILSKNIRISQEWITLSIKDCEASKILFNKKLYPHSLYFLYQSVEKGNKAIGFFLDWISDGKQIGHDLTGVQKLVLKREMDELIAMSIKKVDKKSQKKLNRNPSKFISLLDKEDAKKINNLAMKIAFMKKYRKYAFRDINQVLRDSDIRWEKVSKMKEPIKNLIKKLDPEIKKGMISDKKTLKLYRTLLKKVNQHTFKEIDYAVGVFYDLAIILPDIETYRYPEHKPFTKYNKQNSMVTEFKRIVEHLDRACGILDEIYHFKGIYSPKK